MTEEAQSTHGLGSGVSGLPVPRFEYSDPRDFFKQFKRYANLKLLTATVARDLMCFAIGSCKRASWVADRVEEEVTATDLQATIQAVETMVLQLLTPEVLKGQILQQLDQRKLQPGEAPREYVESRDS